ncbi:MAG: hypothetical protein PVH19_07790 [Planctomycetia bacterium]
MNSSNRSVLRPWMYWLLRFAGTFNFLAGFCMLVFYHEGYKMVGVPKPALVLPIQLTGILVVLFGVGYHLSASDPLRNRNVLALGMWSKLLCSLWALIYVFNGALPWWFILVLLGADIAYVPLFVIILRQIDRIAKIPA